MSQRAELLKKFFGSLGKNSFIEPPLNVDYGCNILIGDDFYSNFGWVWSYIYLLESLLIMPQLDNSGLLLGGDRRQSHVWT